MGYTADLYLKVQRKLEKSKSEAEDRAIKRKNFFYKRFPRAVEIEKELSSSAVNIAKSIIYGDNRQKKIEDFKNKNLSLQDELSKILAGAGLPKDYLEPRYNCDKCRDTGFVDGKMCECMKNLLKKEAYSKLNQISPLKLSNFNNFSLNFYPDDDMDINKKQTSKKRMSLILDYCMDYAKNFSLKSPSLLLRGATGLGKTHLSLAIANYVINSGFGVIYVSAYDMVNTLEKAKFKPKIYDPDSEKHFIYCDLLIIDDLGNEFPTTFSNAMIYNVVNARIMMSKPTIINTNLTIQELENNYNERMVSRIIGNNICLEFFGNDIRQKKLKLLLQNKS